MQEPTKPEGVPGQPPLRIENVSRETEAQVRALVLAGLEERFGWLDSTLNPDLEQLTETYRSQGAIFLVGLLEDRAVCCGAYVPLEQGTGRIVRMSVHRPYRRLGYAGRILAALEQTAAARGCRRLELKTLAHWSDAVGFYKKHGYVCEHESGGKLTMSKPVEPDSLE
ncbi:hypothetical protein J31TS4_10370 [Paenibacillus sp. J31TS4]|uniref:GNAT family N-acetyltransferase n=1 Tax=Paenibacillus sp. J31TS4 TaxID=2807195 RepID=UPI001B0EBCB5|nr:GNAT family N-acetyltransferase [Paenibacillus sp. J31TS4]GIP37757.1 hypothetical protein J31TS4_10370 [Paenibacillus sp. J31TS4]